VRGRRVVDVASGSGLVAIAAALAGASEVRALDVDGVAVVATRLNAAANHVRVAASVGDVVDLAAGPGDLVVAGDVCYERAMAERMLTALRAARSAGADVLIGDPLRAYLPDSGLTVVARYDVDVDPELESAPIKHSVVAALD
jgi:predicted nicotinamide N-methyase